MVGVSLISKSQKFLYIDELGSPESEIREAGRYQSLKEPCGRGAAQTPGNDQL